MHEAPRSNVKALMHDCAERKAVFAVNPDHSGPRQQMVLVDSADISVDRISRRGPKFIPSAIPATIVISTAVSK